jgi:hypothetical protein
MKDITIFENFINDEELEEARRFTGDKSLNLNEECHRGAQLIDRNWYYCVTDKCHKRFLMDCRFLVDWDVMVENLILSAKNFIMKIVNRTNEYTNLNLGLERVYINRQVCGQDVPFHVDGNNPNIYTLLIYIGDITPENYHRVGGDLEFKDKKNTRIEPFVKRAVLFKGYIPHRAYAPLVPDITRFSFAFKFVDTSNELPFFIKYN